MPQQIADVPRADALSEQKRRAAMAQIVEPNLRELCGSQDQMELTDHASRIDRRTNRRREHKTGFLPAGAGHLSLFVLFGSVGNQGRARNCWQIHRVDFVLFGRGDRQLSIDTLNRLPNYQRAVFQVHIGPLQCERFALAISKSDRCREHGFVPIALGGVQEGAGLFRREGFHLSLGNARRIDQKGYIPREQAVIHSRI